MSVVVKFVVTLFSPSNNSCVYVKEVSFVVVRDSVKRFRVLKYYNLRSVKHAYRPNWVSKQRYRLFRHSNFI